MSRLRQRAPRPVKGLGRQISVAAGRHTASLRMTPSFVLAGAQRCGTTSLYRALSSHPTVVPPVFHKGVNYFDLNYDRGLRWYLAHFPVRSVGALRTRGSGEAAVSFEASGYYMYHPFAADRLARDLPGVKLLVMLRDPVERAFSAWKHERARHFESEEFETALELEDERVLPELRRMLADQTYQSVAHRHQSYRMRGQYAEQLGRLVSALGRDRVLVVESVDFFARPDDEYRRITDFLGLRPYQPRSFEQWNARPSSEMATRTREWLTSSFEPYDAALAELMGHAPSWRR